MKITTIEYSALFNTGNYENEKVGLTVQLEEGETVEELVPQLRRKTAELVGPKAMEQVDVKYRLNRAVQEMQEKAATAQEEYEQMREFMRAQGIKTDMPSFPMLKTLLPAKDSQPKLPEPDFEFVQRGRPIYQGTDIEPDDQDDDEEEIDPGDYPPEL